MKTVHKSFHLRLFVIFSSSRSSRRPNLSKAPTVSVRSPRYFFFYFSYIICNFYYCVANKIKIKKEGFEKRYTKYACVTIVVTPAPDET